MGTVPERRAVEALTVGNTAKLYCLNWIDRFVTGRTGVVTILDLGCGEALNFQKLLERHPHVQYVGVEPDRDACLKAQRHLDGLPATFVNAPASGVEQRLQRKFDIVVSFSVLEHVYGRREYLRAAARCLEAEGHVLMNYDLGHFVTATMLNRFRSVVRAALARLGMEQYYLAVVDGQEVSRILHQVGLRCIDQKFFNVYALKEIMKIVPESDRPDYMDRWLSFELEVNDRGIESTTALGRLFGTCNLILVHGRGDS